MFVERRVNPIRRILEVKIPEEKVETLPNLDRKEFTRRLRLCLSVDGLFENMIQLRPGAKFHTCGHISKVIQTGLWKNIEYKFDLNSVYGTELVINRRIPTELVGYVGKCPCCGKVYFI